MKPMKPLTIEKHCVSTLEGGGWVKNTIKIQFLNPFIYSAGTKHSKKNRRLSPT